MDYLTDLSHELNRIVTKILNDPQVNQSLVRIKELVFYAHGVERTSQAWIGRLHSPEAKPESIESKRNVRTIFRTEKQVLMEDAALTEGVRQFQLKFRLPATLPPTFKGTTIRFSYSLDIRLTYEIQRGQGPPTTYETVATTPLLVIPSLHPAANNHNSSRRISSTTIAPQAPDALQMGKPPLSRRSTNELQASGNPALLPSHHQPPALIGDDLPLIDYSIGQLELKIRCQEVMATRPGVSVATPGGHRRTPSASQWLQPVLLPVDESYPDLAHLDSIVSGTPMSSQQGIAKASFIHTPAKVSFIHTPAVSEQFKLPRPPSSFFDDESDDEQEDQSLGSKGMRGRGGGGTRQGGGMRQVRSSQRLLFGTTEQGGQGSVESSKPDHAQQVPSSSLWTLSAGASGSQQQARKDSLVTSTMTGAFSKSYVLSAIGAPVLKVTLQPPMEGLLQPGATFCGLLDFRHLTVDGGSNQTDQPPRCHELSVMLESEEIVAPFYSSRGVQGGSRPGQGRIVRSLHCEHQEVTTEVSSSSFVFTVPSSGVPSFRTPMVSHRWVLRFELSVGAPIDCSKLVGQKSKMTPQLQQVSWALPLFVSPPSS